MATEKQRAQFRRLKQKSLKLSLENKQSYKPSNPHYTELRRQIIRILDVSVKTKSKIRISFDNGCVSFVDDTTGQRDYRLIFSTYGERDHEVYGYGLYKVIRKLTFTNHGDEGKEDAVLCCILVPVPHKLKNPFIRDTEKFLELGFNGIQFSITKKLTLQ